MKSKRVLFYVLAALAAGCLPVFSLQPLFTDENMTFDEGLLGTWVEDVNKPKQTWEFSRLSSGDPNFFPEADEKKVRERLYRIDLKDEDGHKGVFVAGLGKLGDHLFLDVFPASLPSGQTNPEKAELFYNTLFFVRVQTFVKVELVGGQLKMSLTDEQTFKDWMKVEPNAIQYQEGERTVLTASTKDLQAFVTKHIDDKRLFANEIVLSRKPSK